MRKILVLAVVLVVSAVLLSPAAAITALGPGYYQNTDSALVYTGTWTTGTANSGSYGGSFGSTTSTSAIVAVYTLPTVGAFGLFYAMNSFGGSFMVEVNDSLLYGPYNSYQPAPVLNQYLQISLPAGTNKVELYSVSNSFYYHAVQLLATNPTSVVNVTAVVSFPTHTPTPTYTPTPSPTPTLTPTAGPSPTATPTITRTPNFVVRATVEVDGNSQDTAIVFQVTAGDVAIVVLLALVLGALIVGLVLQARRS